MSGVALLVSPLALLGSDRVLWAIALPAATTAIASAAVTSNPHRPVGIISYGQMLMQISYCMPRGNRRSANPLALRGTMSGANRISADQARETRE